MFACCPQRLSNPRRVPRGWLAFAALVWFVGGCTRHQQLERALVGRGRIAVFGQRDLSELHPSGTELLAAASQPALTRALAGDDPAQLIEALVTTNISGLLLDAQQPKADTLAGKLAHYARVPGLQGAYLTHDTALYVLDPVRDWSPTLRAGLAEVARRLVGGAPPPRSSSFPEQVRRLDPAEVMVLLRSGDQPRLWRSARGSSFARALLTAAEVARQRWIERSQALGGKLEQMLPQLAVEVALLQDDGEIAERSAAFVDRVVLPVHGVGYERKGGWHYLLPEATHSGKRKPSRAYAQLFSDDGLPEDSLDNPELRLYRLAVQVIGVSPAPASQRKAVPDDGLSEVSSPAQVLGR
jgi:hypothetical protein